MEIPIPKSDGRCAASGRALRPGEAIFATLTADGAKWIRRDFAPEAWAGPPAEVSAWWKTVAPSDRKQKAAADRGEALRRFLNDAIEAGNRPELAYVLAMLLIRRRLLRRQDDGEPNGGTFVCVDVKDGRSYEIVETDLDDVAAERLQREIDRGLERRMRGDEAEETAAAA